LATGVELTRPKRNDDAFDLNFHEIFSVAGRQVIQVTWLDPSHLQIECPGARADEIHRHDEKWDQTDISSKF
jgi:hypothetical protein